MPHRASRRFLMASTALMLGTVAWGVPADALATMSNDPVLVELRRVRLVGVFGAAGCGFEKSNPDPSCAIPMMHPTPGNDDPDGDFDNDGIANKDDDDDDDDGVLDDVDPDDDNDGVLDEDEFKYGTSSRDDDSDDDGMKDGFEVSHGFNPSGGDDGVDTDGDGIPNDNDDDIDNDGKKNDVDDDIDGDGIANDDDDDDDGDGEDDGGEQFVIEKKFDEIGPLDLVFEVEKLTDMKPIDDDPAGGDFDGDGKDDDRDDDDDDEDSTPDADDDDLDNDGIADVDDPDDDNDGLDDDEDRARGLSSRDGDTDGDGMSDGFEIAHGFDPKTVDDDDIDGDGTPNDEDDDIDGDGYLNDEDDDDDGDMVDDDDEAHTDLLDRDIDVEVSEWVFNETGIDWTDYHLELFDAPDGFEFIDFSAEVFAVASGSPTVVDFLEGIVPDGDSIKVSFAIKVPKDFEGQFTVRQTPTVAQVPEPNTLGILGLGLAGLVWAGRRRRD